MGDLRAAVYARASSNNLPVAIQLAVLRGQVVEDELRVPTEREFVDQGYRGVTLARPAWIACASWLPMEASIVCRSNLLTAWRALASIKPCSSASFRRQGLKWWLSIACDPSRSGSRPPHA